MELYCTLMIRDTLRSPLDCIQRRFRAITPADAGSIAVQPVVSPSTSPRVRDLQRRVEEVAAERDSIYFEKIVESRKDFDAPKVYGVRYEPVPPMTQAQHDEISATLDLLLDQHAGSTRD